METASALSPAKAEFPHIAIRLLPYGSAKFVSYSGSGRIEAKQAHLLAHLKNFSDKI